MAASLVSAKQPTSGLRPMDLRRDLGEVATLIETCFAPTLDAAGHAAIQEMRMVSRAGPLLWVLARAGNLLPGLSQGFVWLEGGRIVGNVSVAPAGQARTYVIANVAVDPAYRRHGIARQLMLAALDQITRQGTTAILQVEADNTPAIALYEDLGFTTQRTFVRWRRGMQHYLPVPLPNPPTIRALARRESADLLDLARRVRPDERGGLGWLRPTRAANLRPARIGPLRYLLSGQNTGFQVITGPQNTLDAALILQTKLGSAATQFDLLVRPERQGEMELPLLNHVVRELGGWQTLITEHPADDTPAGDALRQHQFRVERTLTHMIWHAPRP
ncbi:MAG: GNAT family N-acetyltransferase [Chloroflexi bacterium]|nr:GNAT family N-acetyltransferase [Chloroflexota bacterium]